MENGRCWIFRSAHGISGGSVCVSPSVNPDSEKIFRFTEIRKRRMCRPSRLTLEGRSCCRVIAEPGLRWTQQRRARKPRAGRIALREPFASRGRAALSGSSRHIPGARCTTPSDPVAPTGRAYGKTVWSWPSLLRSSLSGRCERAQPGRLHQFAGRGRPKESSAPGRARHKPSDHRAGKAE